MEIVNASIPDIKADPQYLDGNGKDVEDFAQRVDHMFMKVDQLEQTLNKVEQFYSRKRQLNTSKGSSIPKDKDKDKHLTNFRKRQQDVSRRESAAVKRMQELMRQFGTIIRQITQHKWAGPFMQPVDVVGLGLHDYYDVIKKPMDFSTIKNKMEFKDDTGYSSVREIYADVRLIFENAMKYNDERDDVHVMAKTLLGKVDEKWLQLLPKVDEEEKNRNEEEAGAQIDMQLAQEATHARITKDLNIELEKVDRDLEELRDMVLQNCRRMSTEEKKKLSSALTSLSPEDLDRALIIVSQDYPSFPATSQEVDLNIDSLSESTLWKLKFFVKGAQQFQNRSTARMAGNNHHNNDNNKRKICNAFAKSSQKSRK
ncbi:transcription factor GTE6-like [Apium graveolens]|uniref:transcription factor GTE6-like n=1 Tax=Apium graveolens TaxID=4045 RepID=UPI003D7B696A